MRNHVSGNTNNDEVYPKLVIPNDNFNTINYI